jgi:hypothetical protein
MLHFQKHFTLEEARALLPKLRQVLKDTQRRRKRFSETDEKLGRLTAHVGSDLGGKDVSSMLMDLLQVNVQVRHIQDMGVVIKDFDRGLVDFPHLRQGREVFLCWELEEDDIEFWHDIETGYGGRERL